MILVGQADSVTMGETLMNAAREKLVEDFRSLWDDFCVRCEAAEAAGKWNVEEDGMMEVFFESDLMSVLLDAVSSDGVFGDDEAEVFSQMMDEKFTPHDLSEMYREVSDVVEDFTDGEAQDAVPRLAAIDATLVGCSHSSLLTQVSNGELYPPSIGNAKGEEATPLAFRCPPCIQLSRQGTEAHPLSYITRGTRAGGG